MEGAEPKMPGAPSGIQIMTPQQFVAKAGDMPGQSDWRDMTYNPSKGPKFSEKLDKMKEDDEQGVAEAVTPASVSKVLRLIQRHHSDWFDTYGMGEVEDAVVDMAEMGQFRGTSAAVALKLVGDELESMYGQQGVAEGKKPDSYHIVNKDGKPATLASYADKASAVKDRDAKHPGAEVRQVGPRGKVKGVAEAKAKTQKKEVVGFRSESEFKTWKQYAQKEGYEIREAGNLPGSYAAFDDNGKRVGYFYNEFDLPNGYYYLGELITSVEQGVAESLEQLNRIRKLSGLAEATTLPASTRDLKGQEFQDYMNRIKGTDDIDKKTGQVKLDKKGNEKYVSGKTKSDKYKMPYIHRSSIIEYLGPDGKTYDEDKIKQSLSQRPKALLKQNEKMKHSNGEFEQFFNVGFAALTGIAVDESTDNLIIVNTCPGAGSCKVDCFAMKGGKVQFKAAWQSDGRILTYLLNDPSGFFNQLSAEISKEEAAGKKGDKKFPNGWQTTVRWHDAGDFFSPEYLDMALKMAAKHPDVKFYAYTKMAGAALAQKPPNFIINWSEGANTSQEKQVKAKDANLDTTKNSRIVPDDLFQDLLVKDEKKNLVKGASGQWQVQPDKLPELKQRLASEYGLSANSILSYDEYMAKRKSIPAGMKYNVIVAPGEGDISANDPNIISTLLLRH